ncbi:aminotransferase class IV [Brevundimonas sp.]|uniref:aminotransferase class IV n=1 Tax=Brevundimonas sp. TaxID=1871086 RepID=UPI003F709FBB
MTPILHIDGEPATAEALAPVILSNYGAFTSMQVEDGAVRGLDMHLDRLAQEALSLFGRAVPEARMRERMRTAVEGLEGRRSLRVQLFLETITHRTPDALGVPSVLTVAAAPANPLCDPLRLQTQDYAREAPELKHNATFGLTRARRAAKAAGFDDALFVGPDGVVSEGSIWNIGFIEDGRVIWPRAPMLRGVGQRLLENGLDLVGLDSETRVIDRAALAGLRQAFICNSATPACPVGNIDGRSLDIDPALIDRLQAAWASNAPQTI